MPIRTISTTSSFDACWREVTYSNAMLVADPQTASLAAAFTPFETRIEALRVTQRGRWRDELVADAHVASADRALDALTTKLSGELIHLEPNRESARYKLYFKKSPSLVVKLGLASQLEAAQSWPTALASEQAPSLQALAAQFTAAFAAGKAALAAREAAELATATHRVREILPFIDDLNAARQSVYGELSKLAGQLRKPRGWAESFFRVSDTSEDPPAE